jgi:hypothetical protein
MRLLSCAKQRINIWCLSDTVRQKSSLNFSMLGILLKVLAFHHNFLIYTGCANNNMIRSEYVLFFLVFANRMKARLKN